MTFSRIKAFIEKHEWIVPLALFILFLALTLPGISWGAPVGWHPDEIVVRSIKALHGEWKFSEINFDYPDLPQYTMFLLGKLLLALGKTDGDILVASRILSAMLAGLTVVLTYIIARRIGGNIWVAGLSGLFLICVSEMSHNGRFAHNDTYLVFFTTSAILFLLEYVLRKNKAWLYASFFFVGMAASSKYNGGSLVLAPMTVLLVEQRHNLKKQWFSVLETFIIAIVLAYLGFALGTPKALTWMAFFFKRMIPALLHTGNYFRQPDSVRGIVGQYEVIAEGLGILLFILYMGSLIWVCYLIFQEYLAKPKRHNPQTVSFAIMLISLLALNLPVMISYNYPIRFFLPLMPVFAIFSAFFVEAMYQQTAYRKILIPVLIIVVLFSLAQSISVLLFFSNDARIAASGFLRTLPVGTSLEHTYYPPTIPTERFTREHNYPIYFRKAQNEPLPTSKRYEFNAGEAGLDDRLTDYLVIDSFTSDKFENPYVCADMQVECDFFKQLETGKSDHYALLAEFKYVLPAWLPQIHVDFVNPTIRIYERTE